MSKILSIGLATPPFAHDQDQILQFMQQIYANSEMMRRKVKFLYHQSGIKTRYSVLSDYSRPLNEWKFYPQGESLEPFPSLEQRMLLYSKFAPSLSVDAIRKCITHRIRPDEITHLITVSCTGLSAPGLDLQLVEWMDLPKNIFRTSINFMGCYAAIHGLKMAHYICESERSAKVLVVCTELCTLHFQREATMDNIASSLLFGDGSAAVLLVADDDPDQGVYLSDFYAEVLPRGKKDMAWELSSSGFLMTLSNYIPDLIEENFQELVSRVLTKNRLCMSDIQYWCIHPGGKKILEVIQKSLNLTEDSLCNSFSILEQYGNMSSPTILFVLEKIMKTLSYRKKNRIFGAAFGPGLTMETFLAST